MLEQAADDRLGGEDEGDRRRQRQEQRQFDSAVLRLHRLGIALLAELAGYGRQQDRAEADTDQPERQLVQPVGIINVGDRARIEQAAGQRRRNGEVHLNRAGAHRGRQDELQQLADILVHPRAPDRQADDIAPSRPSNRG